MKKASPYNLNEYLQETAQDFGFITTDSNEIVKEVVIVNTDEIQSLKKDIKDLEKLILPLLLNLKKNPNNAYIHWPNREEIIDNQIEKILKITRK